MLNLTRAIRELDAAAADEFGIVEMTMLLRSLRDCNLADYPEVTGPPEGERCSGEMVCDRCKLTYYRHPMDWRVIGYGNVPFLNVLCDGRRVKL